MPLEITEAAKNTINIDVVIKYQIIILKCQIIISYTIIYTYTKNTKSATTCRNLLSLRRFSSTTPKQAAASLSLLDISMSPCNREILEKVNFSHWKVWTGRFIADINHLRQKYVCNDIFFKVLLLASLGAKNATFAFPRIPNRILSHFAFPKYHFRSNRKNAKNAK